MSKRTKISERTRFEVLKRDGFRCVYCGAGADTSTLHIDHRDPVANGGTDDASNLVTACKACNSGKGPIVLDKPDAKALALKPERLMADGRCPDHGRKMVLAHVSSFDVYARRGGTALRCPVAGCSRWAISFEDGQGLTWPSGSLSDVSDDRGGDFRCHIYLPVGEVNTLIRDLPKPLHEAVVRMDAHAAGDRKMLLYTVADLSERWGWATDDVEAFMRWWGWRE